MTQNYQLFSFLVLRFFAADETRFTYLGFRFLTGFLHRHFLKFGLKRKKAGSFGLPASFYLPYRLEKGHWRQVLGGCPAPFATSNVETQFRGTGRGSQYHYLEKLFGPHTPSFLERKGLADGPRGIAEYREFSGLICIEHETLADVFVGHADKADVEDRLVIDDALAGFAFAGGETP